ncbi:hypothetical protein ACO1O0_005942 [Amphichorda felina]
MTSMNGSANDVSETTRLLGVAPEQHEEPNHEYEGPAKLQARKVLILLGITIVTIGFGSSLSLAPQIQIMEQILCERHRSAGVSQTPLEGGSMPDCKSDDIQSELALLIGWADFWHQVPGIILALPYGFAADRIGRKPVMVLSFIGLLLEDVGVRLICWRSASIPIETIWAMPVFQLLGGGGQIASSMILTMVSDVFPGSQRSSIFFILYACILLGEIVATPLSALAMSWTPWFPFLAGLAVESLGLMTALIVPETMPANPTQPTDSNSQQASLEPPESPTPANWMQRLKQKCLSLRQHAHGHQVKVIVNVLLVIASFLLASIGNEAVRFVVQYASKKFSWDVARSSLLITIKGIINFGALLFLLPQISSVMKRYMSSVRADFIIVQGSVCLLMFGTAVMAFSQHPGGFIFGIICFALGWGYYAALRSVAISLVLPSQTGALNTAIALVQSFGVMSSGPVLAFAFRRGISMGGVWMGLPYMVVSLLFVGAGLLVIGISLPRQDDQARRDAGETDRGSATCHDP